LEGHTEHVSKASTSSEDIDIVEVFLGSEKMPSSCIDFGTNQNDVEQIVTTTNVLKKTKKTQTIKPRQCNKTTQTYLDVSSTFFASSTPIRPHTHDNSIIGECIDTNTSVQDANNQDDSNGECILDTSIQDDVNINNHYAGGQHFGRSLSVTNCGRQ
jgi:hypothetical protein